LPALCGRDGGAPEDQLVSPENKKKYTLFGLCALLSIGLDQWTKVLARAHLKPPPYMGPRVVKVIDGFFNLRYSENTGVAFGMLQEMPGGRLLLTLLAVVAFVLVLSYLRKTDPRATRLHVALGLVGGGAVGNLVDRVMFGRVTDFIVWHVGEHEWPAFNVADAALCVGVGLMVLDMIRARPAAAPRSS
jgi:signal peptidase II